MKSRYAALVSTFFFFIKVCELNTCCLHRFQQHDMSKKICTIIQFPLPLPCPPCQSKKTLKFPRGVRSVLATLNWSTNRTLAHYNYDPQRCGAFGTPRGTSRNEAAVSLCARRESQVVRRIGKACVVCSVRLEQHQRADHFSIIKANGRLSLLGKRQGGGGGFFCLFVSLEAARDVQLWSK